MLLASLTVTLLTIQRFVLADHGCPEGWLVCGNGRCVASFWICDEDDDCGNMKDEENCHISDLPECTGSQFQCDNGVCLPLRWHCDGHKDCLDGSDEIKCENNTICEGFLCRDKHCIPSRWKCDGEKDCDDGFDEELCLETEGNLCQNGEFSCSSGSCITRMKVCDGKKDCTDGSDEGSHCTDSCANSTCSQKCEVTPQGPLCICNDGYLLDTDNRSCSDINECLEDGFCSQICENAPGGYSCSCLDGYNLRNRSCVASGEEPLLIFSTNKEIRGMFLRSGVYFPVQKSRSTVSSVDVNPRNSRVYWTQVYPGAVFSGDLQGPNYEAVITNGLLMPEDIAVDYVAGNIYLTDTGLKQILVCKIDGSMCVTLHKTNVDKPRSIVLDLPEALMYWSDWGSVAGIHRSGTDGTQRSVLVSTDIKWPNGIAVDHTTNRLYWCDAQLNRIEYVTLDGKTRKIVLQEQVFHPYSIAIFEDHMYWSDWTSFSLTSCSKFTGHEQHLVTRVNGKRISGVHVYHPVLAQEVSNPCWMSLCSHVCVIGQSGSYRCLCPPGLTLLSDQTTCILDRKSPQVFIAEKYYIYHMQPEAVGNDVIRVLPINQLENVGDVAYNWDDHVLYVSDTRRGLILEVNLTSLEKRELCRHAEGAESLGYDWRGRNLYWVDTAKGTVEVLSLSTNSRTALISNLTRPVSIALAPEKGVMFVSVLGGSGPRAFMFNMDGGNRQPLNAVGGLPICLAVHPTLPLLYWADSRTQTIAAMDYSDPRNSRTILRWNMAHVTSIAMGENFFYWLDLGTRRINVIHSSQNTTSYSLGLPGNYSGQAIRKIHYASIPHRRISPCDLKNGGCSDICLLKPFGYTCNCPVNKKLTNGATCVGHTECGPEEFKCVKTQNCVPLDFRCDGTHDCDDGSDEDGCDSILTCPAKDFQCENGRCIAQLWRCDNGDDCGDGSDERNCTIIECPETKFSCGNGQCVPIIWRCDGANDCDNGHDEEACHETTCQDTEIRCDHGQCIPLSWACDGTKDCKDGSDENEDMCRSTTPVCLSDDFRCADGACIDHKLMCDHRDDCSDGSDERDCVYNTTCKKGMFQCSDGTCIYSHEVCDGYFDCSNDETKDCKKEECNRSEFFCSHSSRCIPILWLCDGDDDCGDAADEHLHRCYGGKTTPKSATTTEGACKDFACSSGAECLPWSKVCDGKPDCSDYSDEGSLCVSSCGKTNGGCAHLCSPSPKGSKCACLPGYKLGDDGKSCEDENECEIPGRCSQFCNNTKGSFKCSCAKGYFLTQDHQKCKADGGPATLVYLLPDQIRGLEYNGQTQRVYFEQEHLDMRGFDYDAEERVFFWAEWKEGVVGRYNVGTKRNSILIKQLTRPYFIKWDWIAKNMYITTGEGKIVACSGDGEYCTTILSTEYSHISSIEIAPQSSVLFWSVWSDVRKTGLGFIERTNMDGSGRVVIISDKIYWPASIAVDGVLENIYWTDGRTNLLEVSDYHGLNRRVIVRDGMYHAFSMAVFEDYAYWADWGTDSLIRCNKFTGDDHVELHKGDVKAEVISIVHKVKQPKGANNCLNSGCAQICLPKPGGYTCSCDRNFVMKNQKCVPRVSGRGDGPGHAEQPDRSQRVLIHGKVNKGSQGVKVSDGQAYGINTSLTSPGAFIHSTPVPFKGCDDSFCKNDGRCFVTVDGRQCRCSPKYHGLQCEFGPTHPYDYSWVVAVFLSVASIAVIIVVILICKQNRSKLNKIGGSLAVSFRNPRYLFRKRSGLVLDTDDSTGVDELMLGKKAGRRSGFGNPLFNQRPYLESHEAGDYKRWPSYDSDDSAFVSEHQSRDGSCLNIEHSAAPNTMNSRDKFIQFFKRT